MSPSLISFQVNGVETFPELFDQRRRWWNNSVAHGLSNLLPKVEPGKWNHYFRTAPRLVGWVLFTPSFWDHYQAFWMPHMSLSLWSITIKLCVPRFSIYCGFALCCLLMLLHGIVSFKQRPKDRALWILCLCCVICALSIVLWLWIGVALLVHFGAIDEAILLDLYPPILKGDGITESSLSACLQTLSLYIGVVIVPKLVLFAFYFALFGVHIVEALQIVVLFFFKEMSGGSSIYNFGIAVWAVSNYFDSRWGTRERSTDTVDPCEVRVKKEQRELQQLLFRDLCDSPRPALYGLSIACACACCAQCLLPFALPLLQYALSALFAMGWVLSADGASGVCEGLAIAAAVSQLPSFIMLFVSKIRNIELIEPERSGNELEPVTVDV